MEKSHSFVSSRVLAPTALGLSAVLAFGAGCASHEASSSSSHKEITSFTKDKTHEAGRIAANEVVYDFSDVTMKEKGDNITVNMPGHYYIWSDGASYITTTGRQGCKKVLEAMNDIAPTAELKPATVSFSDDLTCKGTFKIDSASVAGK